MPWLEHASDDAITAAQGDVLLTGNGGIPQPHATPAYDLANGTQFFLGPFAGLQFGP